MGSAESLSQVAIFPMMQMTENVLPPTFYSRPTLEVAPELLGKLLCRRLKNGTRFTAPIVEVEAYTADDPACHAFRGRTQRCQVMFGPAGHAYVYFIYGMYNCLNVVTEPDGTPGAVLIRAIGAPGGEGPGKLCRLWQITREHNGLSLTDPQSEIWIAEGSEPSPQEIASSSRVGISQATDRPWRYFIRTSRFVSGRRTRATPSGGMPK